MKRLLDGAQTGPGIGALAFAEALFLPVPIEAALAPVMIARPRARWRLVWWALLGSVLGVALLYGVGALFFEAIGTRIIAANGWEAEWAALQARIAEEGALAVAVVAVTPIPFTLAALGAGAAKMNLALFLLVAGAVRGARYAVLAALVGLFGERVAAWIAAASQDPRTKRLGIAATVLAGMALMGWWAASG